MLGIILSSSLQVGAMLQAGLARSSTGGLETEGCGITKYSSAHSFNPLLVSKSTQNLSVKKVDFSAEKIPFFPNEISSNYKNVLNK